MDSVLRALAISVVLLVITRFSGRRTMGELTLFEFVLLLIIAEATQQALLGEDFSVTNGVVLIVTLFAADTLLSYLKGWSPRVADWVDGRPTVLIARGIVDRDALGKARVDIDEILAAARSQQGLERLDQVKFAVLEANGKLSIIPKDD